MKQFKPTVKVSQDYRRIKDGSKFPLKLCISHLGVRKYYATGFDASKEEWKIINSEMAKGRLRTIKNAIAVLEDKVLRCIEGMETFKFTTFEADFFDTRPTLLTVESAYKSTIVQLRKNDQHGTAAGYQTAMHKLTKFKKSIKFEDVTKGFLQEFEKWMLSKGKSITTVGIYLKTLRAIMNYAKSEGIISEKEYPFGRRKYIIPCGRNFKRAIDLDQIEKVFKYEVEEYSSTDLAKDFWIFSYLCNGINMMDIAYLRWSEILPDKIVFERSKTKRTKRDNPVKIVALRHAEIDRIIKKWGTVPTELHDTFVFTIISNADDHKRAREKVQQFTRVTNKYLKVIGNSLQLPVKLTTYTARHSFATMIVRGGAPLAFASQTLGHSSILTTQRYIAGFDLKSHSQYVKSLTNFGDKLQNF